MRKLKSMMLFAAAFAAIPAAQASAAETQSLTIFAKSEPRYVDGEPSMCSIYFSTIFVDQSLGNRAFFAEGTFGTMSAEGGRGISPFTKAAVGERIPQTEGYKTMPVAISGSAFTGSGGVSTKDFESVSVKNPDSPLAEMSAYKMRDRANKHDFVEIFEGLTTTISFRLSENGKLYSIPVDLTLEGVVGGQEKHSPVALKDFYNCTIRMVDAARQNNRK